MKNEIKNKGLSYSLCLLCLLLLSILRMEAQGGATLSGMVFSEQGEPLEGATIRLFKSDSSQYRIALVDSAGRFRIENINIPSGFLSIHHIGFTRQTKPLIFEQSSINISFILKEKESSLGEVMIRGESKRKDGVWSFVLNPEQKKRSYTGYDVIDNLMLPGVMVDRRSQTIRMLGIEVPVYIDGRRVTKRELLALRMHEIKQVDFHDFPIGRFAGDGAAINIILNKKDGGHLSLDAAEAIGLSHGEENLVSKYQRQEYSWAIWAGTSHQKLSDRIEVEELYQYIPTPHERVVEAESINQERLYYLQTSLSHTQRGRIWMLKPGLSYTTTADREQGASSWSGADPRRFALLANVRKIAPNLFGYGYLPLDQNEGLECSIESLYAYNRHDRNFTEGLEVGSMLARERFFKLNATTRYYKQLASKANLSLQIAHYIKQSRADYHIDGTPQHQALGSYEGVFFAGFSQFLSKSLMYRLQLGLSLQSYRLNNYGSHFQVAPRLNAAIVAQKAGRYSLQFGVNLGNTYPNINTLNGSSYKLDASTTVAGNPRLKNATLINPFLAYTYKRKDWSLHLNANYLYIIDPVLSSYQLVRGMLIRSYKNSGSWHDLSSMLDLSWRPASYLELRTSFTGSGMLHRSSHSAVFSVYNHSQINLSLSNWLFGAALDSPRSRLLATLERERTPWSYELRLGYTYKNLQIEMNAYNILSREQQISSVLAGVEYAKDTKRSTLTTKPYLRLRISYTLHYGKKTPKAPHYAPASVESAILQ